MQREIQEIQGLATKYSRAELGRMVQLGLLDPQKAMMAGMMIQRIEQQNAQPPQTTVAQDLLGMPPVPNQPQQPQAPQGMPPMPPQGGMPPPPPQQGQGIEALPTGDVGNYADGGIVAFADKGLVEQGNGRVSSSGEYVPPEYVIHSAIEESKKPKTNNYDPKSGNLLSNTGTGTGDPSLKAKQDKIVKQILSQEEASKAKPAPTSQKKTKKEKQKLTEEEIKAIQEAGPGVGRWAGTYQTKYDDAIQAAAEKYGVDPKTMWRLIYTESTFNPNAVSYAGKNAGLGLMQISHHHKLTDEQRKDPNFSIDYATKEFARLLKKHGDYRTALEKYKGVQTEGGRRRMASAIDSVLGDTALLPPIQKKKKEVKPLKKGEVEFYPIPPQEIEITRQAGKPTIQELIEQQRASQEKLHPTKKVKPTKEPYSLSDEYNQDRGGMFYPEDLMNYPEFFQFSHGGVTSLAHGGYIPRYAGEGSSQVTTSAVPTPDMFSYDPTMPTYAGKRWEELPEYKGKGNKLAGSLEEFFSNLYGAATESMPSQGTTRIDPKTGEPISLGEFMRRAEAERTEGARRSLPPIAKPTPKEATAEEKAAAKNVGARMPPVEVRPEPEPKEEAPKEERKSKEENYRGLKLPGLGGYNVDIPVYTGDMPQQTTPEEEYEKRTAQEKRVGYDADLLNKMISNIESKRGDAATEKDKAIGEAIMIASMKLMGARRGQEFQMLSEGAQEGFKAYQASMRDFKNRQEKLDERIETLKIADAQARRSGAESDIARAQRQQEMYYKAQQEFAKAKSEAAYRGAYLATTMRDTDANIFGNIASHQISAAASRSAQAPANIQLAERVAKEKGISFTEAYSLIQNMNVDPKEEMKLREKYAGDFLLRRQYKTVDDYLRAMGVGGGGGGGGKLQAGPDGKIRYVPGGQ